MLLEFGEGTVFEKLKCFGEVLMRIIIFKSGRGLNLNEDFMEFDLCYYN